MAVIVVIVLFFIFIFALFANPKGATPLKIVCWIVIFAVWFLIAIGISTSNIKW